MRSPFVHIGLMPLLISICFLACAQNSGPKHYGFKVEEVLPHDETAYTQGLFIHNGFLYESTGQRGASRLQKVDFRQGRVLQKVTLKPQYFGEGACIYKDRIYQLTWQEQTCFVYDAESLQQIGTFSYRGEGWGLTTDGVHLIMSDGSSTLYFRDPETFAVSHTVKVMNGNREVDLLNELEYIEGEVWANVYTTDRIVRIDPATGNVTGIIDLSGLLARQFRTPRTEVLNGIAYDAEHKHIYVTGKYWAKMYRISLVAK
ncbi:MAG: glutaminyl-peptide cyclotransferase [Bacteroidales bacterium]|nr:glutaminyl-peptide cyclotransferase [Bacteroidales bacterium]MCL2739145.1 glutaminyl-peptide cyclotransferase [Bacteroidales bacterium]